MMRPVDRGAAPATYTRYEEAGPDLLRRLGDYCSYCERQIETNLAVEHIQPKSVVPSLITEWTNLLLACVNCNSTKGRQPIVLGDYFWPDVDNTLRAFEYRRGGRIVPRADLSPSLTAKALATLRLTGLDRDPGNPRRQPSPRDWRWHRRREAWKLAKESRSRLARQDTPDMREQIVATATGRGMFCIWWSAFEGKVDMRRRLREAFAGTHAASFDGDEKPVLRVGGQL